MTEDQIDRIVEREMDKLDRMLTNGLMTQEQYDEEVSELDKWANDMERKYRNRQYREW